MYYECKECGKSFANKSNLNRHKEKKHFDEEQDEITVKEMENEIDEIESETDESETDDENEYEENITLNVWKDIYEDSVESEKTVMEIYKEKVWYHFHLRKDKTHRTIMKTLQRIKDEEDDMDFFEALELAIDKRRFLIQRQTEMYSEMREDNE